MPDLLQDVVVTLAALWAAWVIVRRVLSTVGPGPGRAAGCDHCAGGGAAEAARRDDATPRPLTLIRDRRP